MNINDLDAIMTEGKKLDDLTDEETENLGQGQKLEDDTSKDSSTEQKTEDEKEEADTSTAEEDTEDKDSESDENKSEEDNVPFHKHPRFKELVEEKNKYKEELEEFKKEIDEKLKTTKTNDDEPNKPIPQWFKDLFGNNQEAWEIWAKQSEDQANQIKQGVLDEINKQQEQLQKQQEEANNYVEKQFNSLEAEGHKFDRNELKKVMLEYAPTDGNDNLDFSKGLKILEAIKSNKKDNKKSSAKKKVASITSESSNKESKPEVVGTSSNLRNKDWFSLARGEK